MNDRRNTIFGWILFGGIVALGLSSVSGKIFHADSPERPETLGYFIEGAEEASAEEGPSLAAVLNEVTAEQGEKVFAKCISCHTIEQGAPNGTGPNLYAIMGQPIGKHMAGFAYSSALAEKGGTWTYEEMDAWLTSPRAYAPGTKMAFAGLSKIEDRAAVSLYMNSFGSNLPLPAPPATDAPETVSAEDGAAAQGDGEAVVTEALATPEEAILEE